MENNKENDVSSLMLQEHAKLNKKMADIQRNIGIPGNELVLFLKELKEELKKHFNLEEEAIFDLYDKISEEGVTDMFEIMQEHGEIMGMIKHIEKELIKGGEKISKNNLISLKEKLIKHLEFENETFYKDLDEKLDEQEKQHLIKKIIEDDLKENDVED